MDKLSYHGKTVEQAEWVLKFFGDPQTREFYANNEGFQEWLEACHQVVEARRLDY
jgi:hypothetical protein